MRRNLWKKSNWIKVKFMNDKVYLIKEKLMRWKYGIVIRRIYNADEPI